MCASPPSLSAQHGVASWKWGGRHNGNELGSKNPKSRGIAANAMWRSLDKTVQINPYLQYK
jgi:hypothetical protein